MTSREHPNSPPSKKKVADGAGVGVHPFFSSKSATTTLGHFVSSPTTVCHYLHLDPFVQPKGENEAGPSRFKSGSPTKTHLPNSTSASASTSLPTDNGSETENKSKSKANRNGVEGKKIEIVFYDLDGTLIKTRTGSDFPTNRSDWQWWDPSVPTQLKKEWEQGKHLVVLSNQGDGREKVRSEWKAKLPLIAAKVSPASKLLAPLHTSASLMLPRWHICPSKKNEC